MAYELADLHGGTYEAAVAHERDDHLPLGMAGPDLIGLLFEGFEIPVIDFADDINKHTALAIRCMVAAMLPSPSTIIVAPIRAIFRMRAW